MIGEILKEEKFWKQRARINWLKAGNKNTSYFHSKVTHRRKQNFNGGLQDNNDRWQSDLGEIKNILSEYFNDIYASHQPRNFNLVTSDFAPRVPMDMNRSLTAPLSLEEVKHAVFSINPRKAPGEDGFTSFFFQKYWEILGTEIFKAVLDFFNWSRCLKMQIIQLFL